jgi:hypothetical protein
MSSKAFSIEITSNDTHSSKEEECLTLLSARFFSNPDYTPIKITNFILNSPRHKETNQGFSFGPHQLLPLQGWKIHISFPQGHAFNVIENIAPVLLKEFPNVTFKIPDALAFERAFGNKENSQYGKLMTIYPKNTFEFQKIVIALKPILEKIELEHGPFVQPNGKGDISLQTPGLFARYGRFTPSTFIADNEVVRVDKFGNALDKKNQIIFFKNTPVNLSELNRHLRPVSKEEKEEMNEIFNHLRNEGALEKDDRSLSPIWAKKFIENSSVSP